MSSEKSIEAIVQSNYRSVERRRETTGKPEPSIRTLAEILENPEALEPPKPVVPYLAWKERVTLLSAREKTGKTTLIAAGAAAVSQGAAFLGQPTHSGRVLWVKPPAEGHLADLVQTFMEFGVEPSAVVIMDRVSWPDDPVGEVEEAARRVRPDLIIVDTLASVVQSLGLDPGNSSKWSPVMDGFARLAQLTGAAVLVVHHGRKKDGAYRDSTAIGAGPDMLLSMHPAENDPRSRRIEASGRWTLDNYVVTLVQEEDGLEYEYDVLDDVVLEEPLDDRILRFLPGRPGATLGQVRAGVRARKEEVSEALSRLEDQGKAENRGTKTRHRWFVIDQQQPLGPEFE